MKMGLQAGDGKIAENGGKLRRHEGTARAFKTRGMSDVNLEPSGRTPGSPRRWRRRAARWWWQGRRCSPGARVWRRYEISADRDFVALRIHTLRIGNVVTVLAAVSRLIGGGRAGKRATGEADAGTTCGALTAAIAAPGRRPCGPRRRFLRRCTGLPARRGAADLGV